jgi:putative DNA primase/helicase
MKKTNHYKNQANHTATGTVTGTSAVTDSKHLKDWQDGSGVSEEITRLNVVSFSDSQEIAKHLGWKAYRHTPGWWVSGIDPKTGERRQWGQFKPDVPLELPDEDKPAKYLTPKHLPYEAILLETGEPGYWQRITADPSEPIVITEGAKKAGAGLTHNIPTVALAGVWMGQHKKRLIPDIELFAVPGRPVYLGFDSDILFKPEVKQALIHFATLLKRRGCVVFVVLWETEHKGMDDFIKNNGGDAFKERIANAVPYSEWLSKLEGQFGTNPKSSNSSQRPTPPPEPVVIANELVEKYKKRLAWNDEAYSWYRYEAEIPGVWSPESEIAVKGVIQAELDSDPRTREVYTHSYLVNVINLMQPKLLVRRWDDSKTLGLLPLSDGVLELKTGKFLFHAPGYRFTWALPFAWGARNTGCKPIQDWLLEAMNGERDRVELLRAYLNACVTGRIDLQRFIECIGPGGSGKSTYIRLAMALLGARNVFTTELKHLEQNRFEAAGIYGKRLVVITDSERYGGNVTVLKALTGQDPLRYEQKYMKQSNGFTPNCMVIVAANEQIQSADYTSGLTRRRLTVPFSNAIAPEEQRDLISFVGDQPRGEFAPYLPGLLLWVLQMSAERVTELVRTTERSVPSLAKVWLDSLCDINPLADWLDSCVIHNPTPGVRTQIGIAKRDKSPDSTNTFLNTDRWLYASYCEYSIAVGSKPVSQRRFSNLLHDLCVSQLKLPGVSKGRDATARYFEGLSIRHSNDTRPGPITAKFSSCDGKILVDDGLMTAETTGNAESDGYDAFLKTSSEITSDLEINPASTFTPYYIQKQTTLLEADSASTSTLADSNPSEQPLSAGDRVIWHGCPGSLESLNPFNVINVEGDQAWLAYVHHPVPIAKLSKNS